MDKELLEKAQKNVGDTNVLINAAARRAAELARGAKPAVRVMPDDARTYLDIAIEELAEEKITVEYESTESSQT